MELIKPMLPAAAASVRNKLGRDQKAGWYPLMPANAIMKHAIVRGKCPRVIGTIASAVKPITIATPACSLRSFVRSEFQPTNNWLHNARHGGRITSQVTSLRLSEYQLLRMRGRKNSIP